MRMAKIDQEPFAISQGNRPRDIDRKGRRWVSERVSILLINLLAIFSLKPFYPSSSIQEFLLPGEEGMAI